MIVSPILPVVLARCPLVRFAMIRRKGVHREGASLRSWLRRRLIVHDDSISYCSVSEILDMVPHWICDAPRYGLQRWSDHIDIDKDCPHPRLGLAEWRCPQPEAYLVLIGSRGSSAQTRERPVGHLPGELGAPCRWRRCRPVRSAGVGLIHQLLVAWGARRGHSAGFVMRRS